ncbi:SDR family NAD(P)-dependent oxidoreductase [Sansalvadorimonas verongulae]|uniref:SDR family NAD(P)-dependent oxidoreductase n=1 Tax=Sansalvadorimonas verongulae TaxID=2172824 RepID=UPI0012BB9AC4|nr:SDR family oxidoreductase [Sansalvadorimonas verongulae]MTI12217.1 SDR family oxidoreductase [Sansalvadorimonas verongulae]
MEGKTVVITGGSSGIGKATALEFAQQGAKVLITGRRAATLDEVAGMHENISSLVADSADPASAELIIDTVISKWGQLDVLVNNAGAGANALLEEISKEKINEICALNILAPSLLSAASLPHLRKTKGCIINVSSIAGHMPAKTLSHYGGSKAALDYMTRVWALELAPDVRVNAVAPGPTDSGALTGMMGLSEEQAKHIEDQERAAIPLGRRGVPEDISHWIVFLAGPSASWVTGQVIGVDGGLG